MSKSAANSSSAGGSANPRGGDSISPFIRKTFNMVSDPSTASIVCWDESGDSFIVLKEFEFASQLLPIYFRHKNFSSFVRQLNFYGFHKRNHEGKFTKFYHPFFKRDQVGLLKQIKRKSTESSSNIKETVASLASQVRDLKSQYDDLLKIQRQILFMFGSYMRNSGNAAQTINRIQPKKQRLMLESAGAGTFQPGREAEGASGAFMPGAVSSSSGVPMDAPSNTAQVELLDDEEEFHGGDDESHHPSEGSEFDEEFDGNDEFHVEDPERDEAVRKAREEAWSELNALQDLLNQFPSRDAFLQHDQVKQFNQRGENRQSKSTQGKTAPRRPEPINVFNPPPVSSAPLSPMHTGAYPSVPASALGDSLGSILEPPKLLYGSEHYEKEEQKRIKTESPEVRNPRKRKSDEMNFFSPHSGNSGYPMPLYEFQPPATPPPGFSSGFSPIPQRTMSTITEPLMAPPILYAQSSGDPAQLFPSPDPDPPLGLAIDGEYSAPASPNIRPPASPSLYFSNSLASSDASELQQPL